MKNLYKKIRLKIAESIWRHSPQVMLKRIKKSKDGLLSSYIPDSKFPVIGILGDFMGLHDQYIQAAIDLNLRYKVVDIMCSDWINKVKKSECELFFTWPNPYHASWKQMIDERIRVMEKELGLKVYPRFDEIWPWESKRRMSYWMAAHSINAPKTWVFYDYEEAVSFARNTILPIVFKPDFGDCARGIEVVRTQSRAITLTKKAFRKGFHVEGHHPSDRIWGCAIFQEFIRDAREWRVAKIGDSLFCYLKGKIADFHSGTKLVEYETPSIDLLNFAMGICNTGQFDCMSIDILEDQSRQLHALEIQSIFGVDPWVFSMAINGVPGRYCLKKEGDTYNYLFEKGIFCENACCNLRIRDGLLKYYGIDIGFWEKPGELERFTELARTKYIHLIQKGI